jgi:hypothetical protein
VFGKAIIKFEEYKIASDGKYTLEFFKKKESFLYAIAKNMKDQIFQ